MIAGVATVSSTPEAPASSWFAQDQTAVVAALSSDSERGLGTEEARSRLEQHGQNVIRGEAPPSMVQGALGPLRGPMNIMLVAVTAVSFAIGEVSTGILIALLVLFNIVLGSRQELKARESVDALSKLQVPQSRVVRDGSIALIPASDIVPGDIVQVEAGDIVPADGRLVRRATLETQEAALTGGSAPVGKDPQTVAENAPLGDRTDMLSQTTSVTRGTG